MIKNLLFSLFTIVTLSTTSIAQYTQLGADIDGEAFGDFSGWSCSLSEDGNRLCVGERFNNEGTPTSGLGSNFGQVRCYEWDGTNWVALGDETHGQVTLDHFGSAISLNAAGDTYVASAENGTVGATRNGYVRVHQLNGGVWQQVGSILEGIAGGDDFGRDVSINAAGTIIAIGAPGDDTTALDSGQARMYQLIGGTWQLMGNPINGLNADDAAGYSVSLSNDGLSVAVGYQGEDSGTGGRGVVRIFDFNGTDWVLKGNSIISAADVGSFGTRVYMNQDATVVAIGDPDSDEGGFRYGLVQVFEFDGSNWIQRGQNLVGNNTSDEFGFALSLDDVGNTLVIGASESTSRVGYVRIFEYSGSNWVQVGGDILAENTMQTQSQYFGHSTTISGDGLTIAAGDYYNQNEGDTFPIPKGSTRAFRRDPMTTQNPVANCQDITVPLDATGVATIVAAAIDNGSFDADGPVTLSINQSSFACADIGPNNVTLTVTDNEGNTDSCVAVVTIEDVTAPTISCPTNQTVPLNSSCQFTLLDYTNLATTSDACDPTPSVTQSPPVGTMISATTTITLTVTDMSGNSNVCTFDIIPLDTTPPMITCPSDENVDFDSSCQYTLLDYTGLATVSDACDATPIVTQSPPAGTMISATTTITLTATDMSGNSDSCTFSVFPSDNTPPSLSCPADQTENLDANCVFILPDYTALAFVFDNCDTNPIVSQSPSPGTPITVATLVTIFADDIDGNISSCTFNVFPVDNTPPTIVCPPTQNETIDASCFFTLPDYTSLATASDNCGSFSIIQTPAAGSIVSEGTTIITLEATDGTNTSTCAFDVVVEDTTPPTAVCQDITVQLDATGTVLVDATAINNGSTDNCSIASIRVSPNTFGCAEVGTPQTVTLTITDIAGNASTCNAFVTVEDNTPPVVSCVDITITLDATGTATITGADIDGGSIDTCGIASLTPSQTVFTCDDLGVNNITLTVIDVHGNTSSCVAVVTVSEAILPEAICQDITVQLDATGTVTILPADVDGGSNDNCSINSRSLNIDTFNCSNVGPNMVTLTVTDTAGNSASCMALVTVEDRVAPEAICQNITIQLDTMGIATITAADVDGGSTDACGIDSLAIDIDTFDCSTLGTNNVTLTVLDVNGNESSCVAIVTIEEIDTPPVAVCQNVTAPIGPDGTATITPASVDAGSIGAVCSSSITLDRDTFTCEDIGAPIPVVFTITNASGATDSCTAFVNVVDTVAPTINCPEDQEVTENIPYILPDYVALGLVTTEDFCSSFTEITQAPVAETPMEVGAYLIHFTATDPSGNTDTCFFRLTVNDVLGVPTQNSLASIAIFPNPADTYIVIENPKAINLQHLTFYDMTGRVILKEKLTNLTTTTIDIASLASASYIVIIATENKQLTKQLVKE